MSGVNLSIVILPPKLKSQIERDMNRSGPRAVIEAMRNVLADKPNDGNRAISDDTAKANQKFAAILTEILKHWQ